MMHYLSLHLLHNQCNLVLLPFQPPLEHADIPPFIPEQMHNLIRKEFTFHHPLQMFVPHLGLLWQWWRCSIFDIDRVMHDNYRRNGSNWEVEDSVLLIGLDEVVDKVSVQ